MGNNSLIKIIIGSVTAILTSIILLLILALSLAYTDIPENITSPAIIIITGISILVGSLISSLKIRKQGIINGGMVGVIYIIALYLLSSMVQQDFGVNTYAIIMIVCSIIAGCLGGIIGVNIKR